MFKKKAAKTESKSAKAQTKKPAVKSGKVQTSKAKTKNGKAQPGKPAAQSEKKQDKSDMILAKLMAIEKEARLEQARDRVDQLEDVNIAANIEQLLKILRSGE